MSEEVRVQKPEEVAPQTPAGGTSAAGRELAQARAERERLAGELAAVRVARDRAVADEEHAAAQVEALRMPALLGEAKAAKELKAARAGIADAIARRLDADQALEAGSTALARLDGKVGVLALKVQREKDAAMLRLLEARVAEDEDELEAITTRWALRLFLQGAAPKHATVIITGNTGLALRLHPEALQVKAAKLKQAIESEGEEAVR